MIAIIGAGPIGSYVAYLLAKAGKDVTVFEAKKTIGLPISCTGIVTEEIKKIIDFDKTCVVNNVNKVIAHAPNGKTAEFKINDIVIDRTKFDQALAKKAQKAGAKIKLNSRIDSTKQLNDYEHIIDASGPNPVTIKNSYSHYKGLQARVEGNFKKSEYHVYLGNDIAPKFFAWCLPESETDARVGLATLENTKHYFDKFLKTHFKDNKVIETQGGLIPIYDKKATIQENNIFLVGDAASQVKSSTGGGIVPGLRAAKILVNSLICSKNYKKSLNRLDKDLTMDKLFIRKAMNNFSDKNYNKLIKIVSRKPIQRLLTKENRDNSFVLLFKLLLIDPRLLFLGRKLF